jgi:hypothetical protein
MSKIALSGNASGTGTFTIASPNSNTDRTVNLPDAGGDMVLTTATQTLTNKTLTSPTLTTPNIDSAQVATVSGTAPIFMCRAWVNFDGTTSPGTIRASGNVSSVTRNGTGDYTVNFTTAMPDSSYSCSHTYTSEVNQTHTVGFIVSQTSTQFRVIHFSVLNATNASDKSLVGIAIFR